MYIFMSNAKTVRSTQFTLFFPNMLVECNSHQTLVFQYQACYVPRYRNPCECGASGASSLRWRVVRRRRPGSPRWREAGGWHNGRVTGDAWPPRPPWCLPTPALPPHCTPRWSAPLQHTNHQDQQLCNTNTIIITTATHKHCNDQHLCNVCYDSIQVHCVVLISMPQFRCTTRSLKLTSWFKVTTQIQQT